MGESLKGHVQEEGRFCLIPRDENWLTVKQTARELQIPLTRCYALIGHGELPAVRIGQKSIRVNRQELEEYLLRERRVL